MMLHNPQADFDLPPSMTLEIGKVVVRWAYFEDYLQQIIYTLVGAKPVIGRIAIREPRAQDRVDMIADLLELSRVKLATDILKPSRNDVDSAKRQRDLLAHGIWTRVPGSSEWHVKDDRGKWDQQTQKQEGLPSKRKIVPEAVPIRPEGIKALSSEIERLLKMAGKLAEAIDASLAPSPDAQIPRSDPQDRQPD